jgi:hypothetical protein
MIVWGSSERAGVLGSISSGSSDEAGVLGPIDSGSSDAAGVLGPIDSGSSDEAGVLGPIDSGSSDEAIVVGVFGPVPSILSFSAALSSSLEPSSANGSAGLLGGSYSMLK